MSQEYPGEVFWQIGKKKGKKYSPPTLKVRFTGEDVPAVDTRSVSRQLLAEGVRTRVEGSRPNSPVIPVRVLLDATGGIESIHLEGEKPREHQPIRPAPPAPVTPQAPRRGTDPTVPSPRSGVFRNPYNFVPVTDRGHAEGPSGDTRPLGHDRYEQCALSGRLIVHASVVTPLLVPGRSDGEHHPTFEIRRRPGASSCANTLPYIAPTGIRGVLRARFEALTNSRFGVASEALGVVGAYRMTANDGARAIPVIISAPEGIDSESACAVPLCGTGGMQIPGLGTPLWAAWIPRELLRDWSSHGAFVEATLRCLSRDQGAHGFRVWAVVALTEIDGDRSVKLDEQQVGRFFPTGKYTRVPEAEDRTVRGWVFRSRGTQAPNRRKRERLFFWSPPDTDGLLSEDALLQAALEAHGTPLAPLIGGWQGVIAAYDASAPVRAQAGNDGVAAHHDQEADAHRRLRHGMLCYGLLGDEGIQSLSPVAIGREPYQRSALSLLDPSLHPATEYNALSPADRVFGWVRANAGELAGDGRVALRSSLRIGQVQVDLPDDGTGVLEQAEDRPLAILSSPKPAYPRFYVAGSKGQPPGRGDKKEIGYRTGNRLRGRKVYPHQQMAQHPSWFSPSNRPWAGPEDASESDQCRTIRHWVRRGTKFTFTIDVRNLSEFEFGALLVTLEPLGVGKSGNHLRLGYGKPLGFGSVRIDQVEVHVEAGGEREQRLRTFRAGLPDACDGERLEAWRTSFIEQLGREFGEDAKRILSAVCAESRGWKDKVLVEYPPGETGYEWFRDNERPGRRRSLPLLDLDQPYVNEA